MSALFNIPLSLLNVHTYQINTRILHSSVCMELNKMFFINWHLHNQHLNKNKYCITKCLLSVPLSNN